MDHSRVPQFVIEGDAGRLFNRLQKGQIVSARIVMVITDDRYLLRIQGHNLVMRSKRKFKRQEEVDVVVKATKPYLILDVASSSTKKNIMHSSNSSRTDIII